MTTSNPRSRTPSRHSAARPTMTARTPEDLLAIVPVVLGFVPTESVAMLTFGGPRPFHARIDLPATAEGLPEVTASLLGPARRHRVHRVVLVFYTRHRRRAESALVRLASGFADADIEVVEALRADGDRWYPLLPAGQAQAGPGTPYSVGNHPFAVQAVVEGRVTHASREELAASLRPGDAALREQVATALRGLDADPGPEEAAARLAAAVRRHTDEATVPGATEAARILAAVADPDLRGIAMHLIERPTAAAHVDLWTALLGLAPEQLVAAPAALLAFAAWQSGSGALAWCAVDRCLEVDPDHRLATVVGQALAGAVPPSVWRAPTSPRSA